MKGAPERIFAMCSEYQEEDGSVHPIDENFKKRFTQVYEKLGSQGKRVIGFCEKTFVSTKDVSFDPELKNYPTTQMLFIGLTGIIDPPRDDVPQAIELCKTAGIRVFMVTGDHPFTAEAIARQIGIIDEKDDGDDDLDV